MGKFGYFKIPGIIVSLVCLQKSDGTHTFDTHSMACFMGNSFRLNAIQTIDNEVGHLIIYSLNCIQSYRSIIVSDN